MSVILKILSLVGLVFITSFTPYSHSDRLCTKFTDSDVQIPTTADTGLSEDEFNEAIDNFEKIYTPILKEKGLRLSMVRKWKDNTVNANTTQSGNLVTINCFGGLARYPSMDYNAFLMVLAHEMGHNIGGYPRKSWATNEGGSDYYATLKGFRILANSNCIKNLNISNVPQTVKDACASQHKSQKDKKICEKGAETGFTLASVLNKLQGNKTPLSFDTPDKTKVNRTDDSHPDAQSRLDTYYAGAVCGKDYKTELSNDSPIPGACSEENKETIGVRPRSWYAPAL